jgi:hypothetical protein
MRDDGTALVAVSDPVDPWDAERICQALESKGIAATFFGRAEGSGLTSSRSGIPFSVGLGRVRIAVHERVAQEATDLIREMQRADSPEP